VRTPDQLTIDEAATIGQLWRAWPHGVLSGPKADHAGVELLVEDGYVEAFDHADHGVEYRLHPDWGERLSRLTAAFGEQASLN